MTNSRTLIILLAVVASLALTTLCQAKEAPIANQQQQQTSSLASKLIPLPKARTSRSLSDMFEKVKSKIFGSRKQAAATNSASQQQVQPSASVNVAQRQPWGDLNSFNQQYSPYSALASSYQWPTGSAGSNQQYPSQQFNSIGGYLPSGSAYSGLTGAQAQSVDGSQLQLQQQQAGSSIGPAANSNSASPSNGGLLSSASHLIAQYLSPSSSSVNQQQQSSSSAQQVNGQQQQQQQNLLTPQQQQQQSQYNEFASILDSMVSQTGVSSQRQPSLNQYLGSSGIGQQQPQQQQSPQNGFQAGPGGNPQMVPTGSLLGDNEMSASSSIQSYLPAGASGQASGIGQQQAQSAPIGQAAGKSSMVGLAEQLAPGAQFNKLVSFPFSLSSNDDPNKEGRYKLHIPFLNQHVKRSDQQQQQQTAAAGSSNQRSQQQQQYLNSYYNQQQQYLTQQQQQQLSAQASQVVPTIVSPQSSPASSSPVASAVAQPQSSSSSVSQQQSPVASISSSVPQSVSSSASLQQSSVPSSASSSVIQSQNSRSAWSVADLQSSPSSSSSSSSKLIPLQQSATSS